MTNTEKRQKRVLAINDMSCLGSCSLTVALPILASFGLETCPLPTALLSTHTGGFVNPSIHDLTDDMKKILAHWATMDLHFEGIYSGYFANRLQLQLTEELIDRYRGPQTLVLCDPVMGDNGRWYSGFGEEYREAMLSLVAKADVITPNQTECALLLGASGEKPDSSQLETWMESLLALGPRMVVITGVELLEKPGEIGYYIGAATGKRQMLSGPKIDHQLHGCGDVFASALCGSLLSGTEFFTAAKKAAKAVKESIAATMKCYEEHWYGLSFESVICEHIENVKGDKHDFV